MNPRGAATLINTPGFAFETPPKDIDDPRRRWAYTLREVSRTIIESLTVSDWFRGLVSCGYPLELDEWVDVHVCEDEERGTAVARVSGLRTCGSVWACPVCATVAADERSEALARVVARRWHDGWRVAHAVLTVRHTASHSLEDVFGGLSRAWRHLVSHRRIKKLLKGVDWHRGIEITWGRNGWHPHVHVLLLFPPGRDPYALEGPLWEAWRDAVQYVGWLPSSRGGYVYQVPQSEADVVEVARYQEKWGVAREASGGPQKGGKGGLSPWQILEAAARGVKLTYEPFGDEVSPPLDNPGVLRPQRPARISPDIAESLWIEYVEVTKGRKRTAASKALSQELREELEKLQEEEELPEPKVVVQLRTKIYVWLLRTGRLAYWLHWVELLGPEFAGELLGLIPGEEWRYEEDERGPPEGEEHEEKKAEVNA